MVLADVPRRWADFFLNAALQPPSDLVAAVVSSQLLPSPDLHFTNMPPAVLEFGLLEPADVGIISKKAERFPTLSYGGCSF